MKDYDSLERRLRGLLHEYNPGEITEALATAVMLQGPTPDNLLMCRELRRAADAWAERADAP
jgi:hypothetical protein